MTARRQAGTDPQTVPAVRAVSWYRVTEIGREYRDGVA